MAQTRIDQVMALTGFPTELRHVPANWPREPRPGKISLLWQHNYHELYHKFSPFTNFKADNALGGVLSDQQPFLYTYIDETGQGIIDQLPSIAQSVLSAVNVTQDTLNDVVRVAKFQVSSWGVTFLGTQFLLQRLQPFDETRIYNPLSVLLSSVQPMTIGLLNRPTRHIEPNLTGIIGAIGLGNFLGIGYQTPESTAGDGALSDFNSGQGKGLVRGATATTALANFTSQWPANTTPSLAGGIISSLTSALGQIFGGGGSQPAGTVYRADETSYSTMALSKRSDVNQPWFANPNTVPDPAKQPTSLASSLSSTLSTINSLISIASNPTSLIGKGMTALFPSSAGNHYTSYTRKRFLSIPLGFISINVGSGIEGETIKSRSTGYTVSNSDKYSNVVGVTQKGLLDKSDMLVQFSYFADSDNNYPTKFSDTTNQNVQDLSENLQRVINNIQASNTQYSVANKTTYSKLLSSGDVTTLGYNTLFDSIPSTGDTVNNTKAVRQEYRNASGTPPSLDRSVNTSNNLRFATSFTSDGLNQVGILKRNKQGDIEIPYSAALNVEHPDWKKYQPYNDDLIAFYFYDVVNQKYIPFRSTVKGISEGNTAFWDELRFIGRADQLYSYNGFSRTLSFSFNIVINSIVELLPTWKKINYLASVTKPSNYTRSETVNGVFNRFIVPPMFMITIGDLYKYQPMVIRNVTINIPEDASWETLNQDNSKEWSYLNGKIKASFLNKNYGQLPREIEISIEGALLEKERAMVGGSHFGHAPRVDNWEDFLDSDGNLAPAGYNQGAAGTDAANYLPDPTTLHKEMVEVNPPAAPSKSNQTKAGTTTATSTPKATSTSTPTSAAVKTNTTQTTSAVNTNQPIFMASPRIE